MKRARGFTIVELLVSVSVIAMLIGILLPAIGKARDQAKLTTSQANLRQLGQAHVMYATEWNDRHFTVVDDNLARYGSNARSAVKNFEEATGLTHPQINLGYAHDGVLWHLPFYNAYVFNPPLLQPIALSGNWHAYGWFRMPNVAAFNQYVNDRFYDTVFYAPKDDVAWRAVQQYIESPGEFEINRLMQRIIPTSYCLSPAALFSPDVFRPTTEGGFQDPWDLNSGFRVPSMSQAKHPALKTHMLEHHWLQGNRAECNDALEPFFSYFKHEPYYFNHSRESIPVALFYDGHVDGLGVREAEAADTRARVQSGHGLWSRDTPLGTNGYFIDCGYDFAATSFHILTTDGIWGRDTVAK